MYIGPRVLQSSYLTVFDLCEFIGRTVISVSYFVRP